MNYQAVNALSVNRCVHSGRELIIITYSQPENVLSFGDLLEYCNNLLIYTVI